MTHCFAHWKIPLSLTTSILRLVCWLEMWLAAEKWTFNRKCSFEMLQIQAIQKKLSKKICCQWEFNTAKNRFYQKILHFLRQEFNLHSAMRIGLNFQFFHFSFSMKRLRSIWSMKPWNHLHQFPVNDELRAIEFALSFDVSVNYVQNWKCWGNKTGEKKWNIGRKWVCPRHTEITVQNVRFRGNELTLSTSD